MVDGFLTNEVNSISLSIYDIILNHLLQSEINWYIEELNCEDKNSIKWTNGLLSVFVRLCIFCLLICAIISNSSISSHSLYPWASCQIRKIAGCASSPAPRVSDPDMHHGTCVTVRDACRDRYLAVSFEVGGGKNVFGISSACTIRNLTYW